MYTKEEIRRMYKEDGGAQTGTTFAEYVAILFVRNDDGTYSKSASQIAFEEMIWG